MILTSAVTVARPPRTVWEVFTDVSTWETWWGGELKRADPGWQKGASLVWGMGAPSTLEECETEKMVAIRSAWSRVTVQFKGRGDSTEITYEEDFDRATPQNVPAWTADTAGMLSKLKALAEARPAVASPSSGRKRWKLFG